MSRRRVGFNALLGLTICLVAATAASAHTTPVPPRDTSVPIVLVPGWFETGRDMATLRIRLIGSGWAPERVLALTFRSPTGGNRAHAQELGAAVKRLLETTGADQVDIVAHSMGGLATRWYLAHTPDAPVRRVAFIASPQRGTYAAYLAWGAGRSDMMPGSPFLDSLNARPVVPAGVEAITIRTPLDTHIVPGESATLEGVPDFEVCCPTHAGLLRDLEVFQVVRRFLALG